MNIVTGEAMLGIDVKVDGYERVIHIEHEESGLDAFIVIHNTKLGSSIGGIRCHNYDSSEAQLKDALRLSEGMTFKCAASGLKHGGGKAVINASKLKDRRLAYQMLGLEVEALGGSYICAGDVGTMIEDLFRIKDSTQYVAGISLDSSLPTALSTHTSIKTLLKRDGLKTKDQTFTVQGLGKVGKHLVKMLNGKIEAYDPFVTDLTGVTHIDETKILQGEFYVPCALGGMLNAFSLTTIKSEYVCGSANNLFDTRNDIITAHNMGIKYVPDFITNCGGVVAVSLDFEKKDYKSALTTTLAKRINTILDISKDENIPVQHAAERLANDRLK
jgi:glutamate dehydrogenase/leucine dehydrogenase